MAKPAQALEGRVKQLEEDLGRVALLTRAVMDACLKASLELYNEVSATNADFKKVWESTLAFRNDQYLWWQVAEYTYDTYLIRNRTRV